MAGTRIRISFRGGQLSANAGCNHLGAQYAVEDGRLVTGQMSTTEIGCDPARHAQDEWLAGFLGSRPAVGLDGDTLTLDSDGTAITLLDREVAEPDVELVGPLWVLDTIVTGEVASSLPAGVTASLRFAADGRVELDTGCNSGGGAYTADNGSLRFGELVATERACAGAAGDVEAITLEVLGTDELAYAIEARSLTIDAGNVGLIFRATD